MSRLFYLAFAAVVWSQITFSIPYKIDADHSNVSFTIRHIVSKLTGHFTKFEGEITFDEKKLESFHGKITIQTASIDTANQKRDDHLRNADFFDAMKYPTITFTTKGASKSGQKNIKVQGDLTMHGVTKPVTLQVEYLGKEKDPWGSTRAGFVVTTKLNRKDYGIVFNKTLDSGGLLLGEEVDINVQIESIEQTPAATEQKAAATGSPS